MSGKIKNAIIKTASSVIVALLFVLIVAVLGVLIAGAFASVRFILGI